MKRTTAEIREMLSLLREFGVPEETIQQAAINAAKSLGLPVDGPLVKDKTVIAFLDEWRSGKTIHFPVVPCMSEDLYRVYEIWCQWNEITPATLTRFGRDLASTGITRVKTSMGKIVDPNDVGSSFGPGVKAFKAALKRFDEAAKKRGGK